MDQSAYVMSIDEVLWGLFLVAVTMLIHAVGSTYVVFGADWMHGRMKRQDGTAGGLAIVILMTWLLILLHLTEVGVWALFFAERGFFPNFSGAYHFALIEYTTLGATQDLPMGWQLLEGLPPISGLITFAWTTAVLMPRIQRIQDRRIRQREARIGIAEGAD